MELTSRTTALSCRFDSYAEDVVNGVLRILERYLLVVVQLRSTTRLSYLFECRKWSFAGVVVFQFSLENPAVAKIMSFLFMERTPPGLVALPLEALTFAPFEVWFGTSRLLIAYG